MTGEKRRAQTKSETWRMKGNGESVRERESERRQRDKECNSERKK